jgi:hypothetical protein
MMSLVCLRRPDEAESHDFGGIRIDRAQFLIQDSDHRNSSRPISIMQAFNQLDLTVSQVSLVSKPVHGDPPI